MKKLVKSVIASMILSGVVVFGGSFDSTTILLPRAEAAIFQTRKGIWEVEIDDDSVQMISSNHARLNFRARCLDAGTDWWASFRTIDVLWGKGYSCYYTETGKQVTGMDDMARSIVDYISENY